MASVISIEGNDLKVYNDEYKRILGDTVPCAAYGMPSTGKLRKGVAAAVQNYPGSNAVLMKYHGALCMGKDLENSFEIALTLEKTAQEKYLKACTPKKNVTAPIPDYGRSRREGNSFILECGGQTAQFSIDSLPKDAPEAALLHAEIYKRGKATHIIHTTEEETAEVSSTGRILRPLLDDLAQIAGVNIKTVEIHAKDVAKELKNMNAVFLKDAGALCTGVTKEDSEAVGMVLQKGCAAELYAAAVNNKNRLSIMDASIQRFIYLKKYSKQKK
jgi:L-fuculose-phosphate aldolase